MKTYKEVFEDNGLVTAMKTADSEKYNEIFGADYDSTLIDDYIVFQNGDYALFDSTESIIAKENGIERLANIIWLKYFDRWKSTIETLSQKYGISYSETETTERSKDVVNTSTNDSTDNAKVFAYDSETASNDTMNATNSQTDAEGNENENITHKRSGFNYGGNLIDLMTKYNKFHLENIFADIVKDDIVNFTCFQLY